MAEKQEYPKALYRGTVDALERKRVETAEEHNVAALDGWGDHPAHRVAAPVNDPNLEDQMRDVEEPVVTGKKLKVLR